MTPPTDAQSDPTQSDPAQLAKTKSSPTKPDPKRFALLIGIDKYHDGTRGSSVCNLDGCRKDVQVIQGYLKRCYNKTDIVRMTWPPETENSDKELFPSKENIKAQFEKVKKKAKAGDFFYFHFSGHGTRLPPDEDSPNHPNDDPSLVTADYFDRKPAFRGWELNKLLEEFDKNGVHVLVTMDSCYSGGAWRGDDKVRSIDPPGMPDIPKSNISDDTEVSKEKAQPESKARGDRNAVQRDAWSINPKHLTLLTACGPKERARESSEGGRFTSVLFTYLEGLKHPATYTMAGAHVKQQLQNMGQTPGVYGRNKLQLFESNIPFIVEPMMAYFDQEKKSVVVPAGQAHGITKGTEFRSYSLSPEVEFAIDELKAYTSSAKLKAEYLESLQGTESIAVIPLRWCFDDKVEITMGNGFPANFSKDLKVCLEKRIASSITIGEKSTASHLSLNLQCETKNGANLVQLKGPKEVIGYSDPVRPLQLHKVPDSNLKNAIAKVIAHLARFKQILDIKGNTPEREPFTVTKKLIPEDQQEPDSDGQSYELAFENTSKYSLYVTILNLTPGFGVGYLELDASKNCYVAPNEQKCVDFTMERPIDPEWVAEALGDCRDIIRVCVSKGEPVSWRALEMPDIWEEFETSKTQECPAVDGDGRHIVKKDRPKWWIHDLEDIVTKVK